MLIYTCSMARRDIPGPIDLHPCAKALKALDAAGYLYEHRKVAGMRGLPWSLKGNREEIEQLSGQSLVPVLVLDDQTVIAGSGEIVRWAKAHPAPIAA